MSDKDMEQNFTDNMKQREKMLKDKQQDKTDKKRKSLEEDEVEKPLNRKRRRSGDSFCESTGSTSSLHSDEDSSSNDSASNDSASNNSASNDSASNDSASNKSSSSEQDTPMLDVNREAEGFVRPERVAPGLSGRCEPVVNAPVAGGAGPRTKAKQKIWYREATSTTSSSPEKDTAMEDE